MAEHAGSSYAPYFQVSDVNEGGYWFGTPADSTALFPNLGIVAYLEQSANENGVTYYFDMQGIPLGVTEHLCRTESVGDVLAVIAYYGSFFGDPASGQKLVRLVVPVVLGWRLLDGSHASIGGFRVYDRRILRVADQQIIPKLSDAGEITGIISEYVGTANVLLNVGVGSPIEDLTQMATARGWPTDFYSVDFLVAMFLAVKSLHDALRDITVRRAFDDDYVLYTNGLPGYFSIADVRPDVQAISIADVVSSLPPHDSFVRSDRVELSDLASLPWGFNLRITPYESSVI
jgi:hypothetical protein